MPPITNLTELWQDREKEDALLLAAKPTRGSDYALFRSLCDAFALMPGHPARARAEEQLRVLFGCEIPPVPAHCDEIWQLTAEQLLFRTLTREDAASVRAPKENAEEPVCLPAGKERFSDYPSLPEIHVDDYAAWERAQTAWLEHQQTARGITLVLLDGFRVEKPSRYSADRHLSAMAPDPDRWTVQMFRFLIHALQKSDKKILLQTGCDPSEVEKMLALAAREKTVPPILWMPDQAGDAARLIDLCRAFPNPDISFAVCADKPIDGSRLAAAVPIGRVRVFL